MSETAVLSRSPWLNELKKRLRLLPKNDFLKEIVTWLDAIERELSEVRDSERIFRRFAQMGVEHKGWCECHPKDLSDDNVLAWCHRNHTQWNRIVHELIMAYDQLDSIRAACEADIAIEDPDPMLPGFGHHIRKEYGRRLLEFLVRKPDPKWVGI